GGPAPVPPAPGPPVPPAPRQQRPAVPVPPPSERLGTVPGQGGQPVDGTPAGARRRKAAMFAAGLVGALLVIAAAVLLTDLGGTRGTGGGASATPSPTPATSAPTLPAGVKCAGADCAGQDPENMGCGGELATTVAEATVGGARVEVRYSRTCAAAWARVTAAAPGDLVTIAAGGATQRGTVDADRDAYTPMVPVPSGAGAKACVVPKSGARGCASG
ncbi:DUF2690 domain-containing protein, partial [Streptomyces sp. NPDC001941]|uniref:DUF2690 domain-containing protein n=1 Tax=Streptomyces sp. NPDC001941 TaxID=3154659 RepID=UPI00332175F2